MAKFHDPKTGLTVTAGSKAEEVQFLARGYTPVAAKKAQPKPDVKPDEPDTKAEKSDK